jgi:AmiR/NasT family two-component response regulator
MTDTQDTRCPEVRAELARTDFSAADSTASERRPRAAMESRAVVEQAKGIIMAKRRCSAPEASVILAKVAEYSGRRPDDLAAALVARVVHRPKEVR